MTSEPHKKEAVKTVAEYSDDALATMADDYARQADYLFRLARGAHAELTARMVERKGTKLNTEHWTGVIKPGAINHTVDDVQRFLNRLIPLANEGDIEAVFIQPPAPPIRVDHRAVNEIRKRGGEIASVIDEERKSVRADGRLELERKPQKEEQQSGDAD